MGLMTLADYQSDLESSAQRGGISTTRSTKWVNDAIREFAYAFKFRELETSVSFDTAAGQYEYNLTAHIVATGFRAMHELGIVKTAPSDRLGKLIPESRNVFLQKLGDTTDADNRGEIKYYHKFHNLIYLRPIPDSTLVTSKFHFWKKITPLVNAGDVSEFDEDWDEIIFLGALYRCFRGFGEFDRYQNIRNDFLGLVRSRAGEQDLEEFPEGSISPVTGGDSEDELATGR